jgi:hypothetical protein
MPPESAAAVTFELTLDDYRALQRHLCRPVKRPPLRYHLLVGLGSAAIAGPALSFLPSPNSFFVGFFAALLFLAGFSMFLSRRARAILEPEPNGSILCRQEYSFADEGLHHRTPHWEGVTRWSGLIRIDETEQHLFLMIDRAAAYTIPKRAFASSADAASFVARIRARLAGR